jgi:two-component system sensor histidine kinase QseC
MSKRFMSSIRHRLLVYILLPLFVALSLIALAAYLNAQHEIEEVYDATLARTTRLLFAALESAIERGDNAKMQAVVDRYISFEGKGAGHAYENMLAINLVDEQGNVLFRTDNSPFLEQQGVLRAGFHHLTLPDLQKWRVFSLEDKRTGFKVLLAQHSALRDELSQYNAAVLTLPFLLLVPVLIGIILFAIKKALKPLQELKHQLEQRGANNLQALSISHAPSEIQPLVSTLNYLFERVSDVLSRERQFTSHAAHELRTPLAALRLQAEVALMSIDRIQQRHALKQIIRGVDRGTTLVEQMLLLARLDSSSYELENKSIDIRECLVEVISTHILLATEKKQELELQGEGSFELIAQPQLIEQLFSNVLLNAINYAPNKSVIYLNIESLSRKVCILDSGPGIDDAMLDKIFDRFYRADRQSGTGSGLGLSIVKRIAEVYGGTVKIKNRKQAGLSVNVSFE